MTSPANGRAHLSIGEVLSLLQDEFPDVTISKIRFLESQGLLDPERTPSGYRKFYHADIERLRWILRQQKEHYLPLKVIKDRLDEAGGAIPEDEGPEDGAQPPGQQKLPTGAEVNGSGAKGDRARGERGRRRSRGRPPFNGNVTTLGPGGPDEPATPRSKPGPTGPPERWADSGWDEDEPEGGRVAPTVLPAPPPPPAPPLSGRPAGGQAGGSGPAPGRRPRREAEPVPPRGAPVEARANEPAEATNPSLPGPGGRAARSGPQAAGQTAPVRPRPNRPTPPGGATAPTGPTSPASGPTSAPRSGARATGLPDARAGQRLGQGEPPPPQRSMAGGAVSDVSLTLEELAEASGLSVKDIRDLERYGLIEQTDADDTRVYDGDALVVAHTAAGFLQHGIEARHMRTYKVAMDREAGLFEQIILPTLRQRNPEARRQAARTVTELIRLGEVMRGVLLRRELRDHLRGGP